MLMTKEEIKPKIVSTIIHNQKIICVIQNTSYEFNAKLNVKHSKGVKVVGYEVKENNVMDSEK